MEFSAVSTNENYNWTQDSGQVRYPIEGKLFANILCHFYKYTRMM